MSNTTPTGASNSQDAEDAINDCLDIAKLRSFFLYAGAGSGKTYTLIQVLKKFRERFGGVYSRQGRSVAVITYTNAACDEILDRIDSDPLFAISTIHSFCWALIQGHNVDIREWIKVDLRTSIAELEVKESKGRGGKASEKRKKDIANKYERLEYLDKPCVFTYSPTSNGNGRDALSHAEVIGLTASFLTTRPVFQKILVQRHPILLIDESQDTNAKLIDALFGVEVEHQSDFALGLIGDTMQRIYGDGKADLGRHLPVGWASPEKTINRRCPRRITKLGNMIRAEVAGDTHTQQPFTDAVEGIVRLFIAPHDCAARPGLEEQVRLQMAEIANDEQWRDISSVKCMMLEHSMAATRLGFLPMFESLGSVDREKTSFLDGSNTICRLFSEGVLPLVRASEIGDSFAVINLLRKRKSPRMQSAYLVMQQDKQQEIKVISKSVLDLAAAAKETFHECLRCLHASQLLVIPDRLRSYAAMASLDGLEDDPVADFLQTPFKQIEAYRDYVSGVAPFDTHQGVKGREFPRVQVVMDDEKSKGFLFSYEKLFEVKALTAGDRKNQVEGKETGVDRTRRLFYVVCTRAQQSLALVAYTENANRLRDSAIRKNWFTDIEIVLL